jgi:glutathione S-transferase
MSSHYTLYGAPLSLYTGKVRSYLIYKNVPYQEVFSSLKVYKKIIIPNTGVRFIPVLKTDDEEYIQDTTVIIDTLEQRHTERSVIPSTPKQKLVSHLFEVWADEWLLIPAMHYRWNKQNFPFIYQEFGKVVAPNFPAFIRAYLGKKIGKKFKGFVPILGINEDSIPAIESWYEDHVLALLEQHFTEYDYLLGGAPSLADFCLMGPLYAHLYRDPYPGELMKRIAPNVAKWVERMNQPLQSPGDWLENDEIPPKLEEILRRLFKEFWPVLESTANALNEWRIKNPNTNEVPRTIGNHRFTMGDVSAERAIMTFHQWKMQRVLACYQGFADKQKMEMSDFLTRIGGLNPLTFVVESPMVRKNNRLVFRSTT